MKSATVAQLKRELNYRSNEDLVNICLRLSKFKKENKELLTYLLFESNNEDGYISSVCKEIDDLFQQINTNSFYYVKKSLRKILRATKKYIRYSQHKETEVELLMHYCRRFSEVNGIEGSRAMMNLYNRQIGLLYKAISGLHPDLQYDYEQELNDLPDVYL